MEEQRILQELIELLEANNIEVRRENLGTGSAALCKIRGKPVLFVDSNPEAVEAIEACAEAVAAMLDVDKIYMRPWLRETVEKFISEKKVSSFKEHKNADG